MFSDIDIVHLSSSTDHIDMKEPRFYFTDCFKIEPYHGQVGYSPPVGNSEKIVPQDTTAYYSCNVGYKLNGSKTNICLESGWNEIAPTCEPVGMNYLHNYN